MVIATTPPFSAGWTPTACYCWSKIHSCRIYVIGDGSRIYLDVGVAGVLNIERTDVSECFYLDRSWSRTPTRRFFVP